MPVQFWSLGLACVAIGLYGTFTARDRAVAGRRGLAALGWIPTALWVAFSLFHAWRRP